MFDWKTIDTVLLDMDGTLLDLHFDNHFWLSLVPQELSKQRGLSQDQSHKLVVESYSKVAGTLSWYCIDYWQTELQLDIMGLHRTLVDRIQLRQDSMPFLDALKAAGKKRISVPNAHPKSLALKLEHSELRPGLGAILSGP